MRATNGDNSNEVTMSHNRLKLTLIVMSALVASSPGNCADNIDFVVGLSLGNTTFEFEEKLDANTGFPSYAVFGSASINNTFATITWSDSVGGENISEEDELGDANRSDVDITLGYRFNDNWAAFVGYKDGKTDIEFRVRDSDIVQDEFYREEGFYAGGNYSWRFDRAGTLSLSAAYIRFDSDLRFTEGFEEDGDDDEEEELEFDDLEGTFSGDADGYSVGATWVMPLTEQLAFRTLFKINRYDLEVDSDGNLFEPEQELRYFQIGLLYAF